MHKLPRTLILALLLPLPACSEDKPTVAEVTPEVLEAPAEVAKAPAELEQPAEWLPPGEWKLDWADEFSGEGNPEKWFPMLGYDHTDFKKAEKKGIRWSGDTEDSSQMYSTKTGNHWLNGEGQLVLRIVTDKTNDNEHGSVVEGAYLLSGYPEKWEKSEPNGVKWAGKFVSPKDGPLYISASVRSDQVKGWSTWFAFWLFSKTRAYNDNPVDGTEVDMVEIVKGKKDYMANVFNVANHWKLGKGGSESLQFYNGGKATFLILRERKRFRIPRMGHRMVIRIHEVLR